MKLCENTVNLGIGEFRSEKESNMKMKIGTLGGVIALLMTFGLAAPALAGEPAGDEPVVRVGSSWVILAGSSLKSTLDGWTRASGWTLVWDSPVDYRMRASASYRGSFEASATALIDSIHRDNPELAATFHRGNRVLHISNNPLTSN